MESKVSLSVTFSCLRRFREISIILVFTAQISHLVAGSLGHFLHHSLVSLTNGVAIANRKIFFLTKFSFRVFLKAFLLQLWFGPFLLTIVQLIEIDEYKDVFRGCAAAGLYVRYITETLSYLKQIKQTGFVCKCSQYMFIAIISMKLPGYFRFLPPLS